MGFSGFVIPRSLREHPSCLLCKACVDASEEEEFESGAFLCRNVGFLSNIFCTSEYEVLRLSMWQGGPVRTLVC